MIPRQFLLAHHSYVDSRTWIPAIRWTSGVSTDVRHHHQSISVPVYSIVGEPDLWNKNVNIVRINGHWWSTSLLSKCNNSIDCRRMDQRNHEEFHSLFETCLWKYEYEAEMKKNRLGILFHWHDIRLSCGFYFNWLLDVHLNNNSASVVVLSICQLHTCEHLIRTRNSFDLHIN